MHIVFFALQTGFSLWMLTDAIQRGRQQMWYIVILVPFGEVAYFLAVYLPESGLMSKLDGFLTTPQSLEQITYQVQHNPSLENKLNYGKALHDAGQYEKAIEALQEILKKHPDHKEVWYGLAHCFSSQGNSEDAINAFQKVLELDYSYQQYQACTSLAREYWNAGEKEQTIEVMERLVEKTHRMTHSAELAEYLVEMNSHSRAKSILEELLLDYENSPRFIQRSNRTAKKQAKHLLKSLA